MNTAEKLPEVISEKSMVMGQSPMAAFEMALSHNVDIDKLEKMLELQARWEQMEAKKAYTLAMAAFKANPPKINKDRHVKFATQKGTTEYYHASLANVTEKINSSLAAHGLSAAWKTEQDPTRGIVVTCTITHKQGYSESTCLAAGKEQSGTKNDIQAIGSTITYLQRYTLLSLTGLATHDQDDDGKRTDPPAMINEKQISTLYDMINATDTDEVKFLAYVGAESLESIPVTLFGKAMAALKAKEQKK